MEDLDRDSMQSHGSIHSLNDDNESNIYRLTFVGKAPIMVFDVYLGEAKGMKHLIIFEED